MAGRQGVQLEEQIGARLEKASEATFKSYTFSCVTFVAKINMVRIVLFRAAFRRPLGGTTLSWEISREPENVTVGQAEPPNWKTDCRDQKGRTWFAASFISFPCPRPQPPQHPCFHSPLPVASTFPGNSELKKLLSPRFSANAKIETWVQISVSTAC